MNCATHNDQAAVAFCRTCGKPLCNNCTRDVRGVIYCEACLAARMEAPAPGVTPAAGTIPPAAGFVPVAQTVYAPAGSVPPNVSSSGPNPAVAGILAGFFPFGVGAVYCSQYAKGLAHLLIFSLLVFGSDHAGNLDWLFGMAIAFFYVFQIIDAVRTAKAIQMGQPVPDPLGLTQTFGIGERVESSKIPTGAVVLIGLGVLFLLHTMDVLEFSGELFTGALLILLAAWIFAKRWGVLHSSSTMCTCPRCRIRGVMGPAILLTVGGILLLDSRDVHGLAWERTWPAILLVIGVIKLMQSTASSQGHIDTLPPITPPGNAPNGFPPNSAPSGGVPPAAGQPPAAGEVKNV
jgi:hypothetical protein